MRLVVLGLILLSVGSVEAAPKVALTAIEGDDNGELREAVAEAIDGKDLSVIGSKETNRAIDKLKIELPDVSEKQAKKLAGDLEADAVMAGWLGKEGTSKLLKFRVFVGGKKVKGFSVTFSNPRSKKFKEAVHDKVLEKVSTLPAEEPVADKGDKTKGKKVAEGDKTKRKKRTLEKRKADGEPDEGDSPVKNTAAAEEEDEEDEEGPVRGGRIVKTLETNHTANRNAVRVDVGSSVSARSLTFTFTPELAADNLQPQPFKPGPVAGARVEGDIFPGAFANPDNIAAGIGIGFEFDQVLSSKVKTTLEPDATGIVKQLHFSVGPRFRIVLGDTDIAPTITIGGSYGRRQFIVTGGFMDRNKNLDLPDTDYSYIAPMLAFRFPLGTPNIALVSINEAMLVQDAGRISDSDQYGRAKVFGIDVQGGFDITIKDRFAIKLMAEFTQIGFSFTGGGEKSRNRDLKPESVDVGGALDRSIGGIATFGVLY